MGYHEYGVDGLRRGTASLYGHTPRMMLDTIYQEVQRFCAPGAPHDDCTMIAMRYLGSDH